ncbi:hypothetical protein HDV05_008355 [Chytridiales sp. JEL 0842]|nr:hypothetical protein HDV05_008355 [Chytridiales sp. JEL 0842]
MIKNVVEELNRIYLTYKARNPKFNGKVSIYGHSLGSLLAFDILCNQPYENASDIPAVIQKASGGKDKINKDQSEVDLSDMLRNAISNKNTKKISGLMEKTPITCNNLEFKVDKLFCVGSPIGLFVLLRGDTLQPRLPGQKPESGILRPAVNSMYNIFHPHDPVAYRVEPLVSKKLATEKPAPIQYNKGGLKGTIVGIADLSSDLVDRGRNMFSGILSATSAVAVMAGFGMSPKQFTAAPVATTPTTPAADPPTVATDVPPNTNTSTPSTSMSPSSSPTKTSYLQSQPPIKLKKSVDGLTEPPASAPPEPETHVEDIKLLNPTGRVDYVLQEGVLENPYLASLSSHMTYWPDTDVAVFMLKELYNSSAAISKTG